MSYRDEGRTAKRPPKNHVELYLYRDQECSGCGHLIVDDGTETVGHFADEGDRSVGLEPSAGCYRTDCKCPGPSVWVPDRIMRQLYDLPKLPEGVRP